MLHLTTCLLLVIASSTYAGIIIPIQPMMLPPQQPPPQPRVNGMFMLGPMPNSAGSFPGGQQGPHYKGKIHSQQEPRQLNGMGNFQQSLPVGPMIYPEMQHVMPWQNVRGEMNSFRHYRPFVPSRPPMFNIRPLRPFQNVQQPFHSQIHMMEQPFQFPQGGKWNPTNTGLGNMNNRLEGQLFNGVENQGLWNDGSMGQWNQQGFDNQQGFGNSNLNQQGFGNSNLNQQGFGDSNLNQQGFGNSNLNQQGFGDSNLNIDNNWQQGFSNGQGLLNPEYPAFPPTVANSLEQGNAQMIGDWTNGGQPEIGAGNSQGLLSGASSGGNDFPNSNFKEANRAINEANTFTGLQGNFDGTNQNDLQKSPVSSQQLKKKK